MVRKKSISKKKVSTTPSTRSSSRTTRESLQQADNLGGSSAKGDSTVSRSHRSHRTRDILIGTKTYKVNVKTLRSIKVLQQSTAYCIPKLSFARVVKEILQEMAVARDMRIQIAALQGLQEAAEIYMTSLFEDCNLAACHAKRITVRPIDMQFVERLRKHAQPALS